MYYVKQRVRSPGLLGWEGGGGGYFGGLEVGADAACECTIACDADAGIVCIDCALCTRVHSMLAVLCRARGNNCELAVECVPAYSFDATENMESAKLLSFGNIYV